MALLQSMSDPHDICMRRTTVSGRDARQQCAGHDDDIRLEFAVTAEDAGIGDPFWYEWTVGQLRIVDMLDPDAQISSVTFQSSGIKGLDDVVVAYLDGRPDEAIQVKHTRVGDTLTFGDLVTARDSGHSLLEHLASSWGDITKSGKTYRAVLYTNRAAGVTRASVSPGSSDTFVRPALADFWAWLSPRVATVSTFAELAIPPEWSRAWGEWAGALAVLDTDAARLEFLKSLEIRTDQPGLVELHARLVSNITKRFGVTDAQAKTLAQALDSALRNWTTSHRRREPVTVEDVMEALSVVGEESRRDHALAPPAPFFLSRDQFVQDLAHSLTFRAAPVVFLTGPPGCGKTSIVSALANRHDPVILLRFHAFRPITPGDTLLPEDSGRTTTSRALWSDLLSQIRTLLRGRLARFAVPVKNEFLSESQLRDHVLRLAAAWAAETRTTAVIAVDGLDHAARSHDPHHASLLQSLPSPESLPASVVLFVAGQPPSGNAEYPVWLRGSHPLVLERWVPAIAPLDIEAALDAQGTTIPVEERAAALRLIMQFAGGNTLSAMFAIYEAASCASAQELSDRLQTRRLSDGLSAYYDAIWSKAVHGVDTLVPLIGAHVASALALTAAPITGNLLRKVFPSLSLGVEQWHELLSRLTPLVSESADGFRLHHNDVRVHLMRQLQSHESIVFRAASGLARAYIDDSQLVLQKHAQAVRLFALCRDWHSLAQLVTPAFVLEGWVHGRTVAEIGDDVAQAFRAVSHTNDWTLLHGVSCAALTLRQLRHSASVLPSIEGGPPTLPTIPPLLPSEGRVVPRTEWTAEAVRQVARDAWTLIRHSQPARARQLLERWFADVDPTRIAAAVPDEDRQVRQTDLTPALELLGRTCAHLGRPWRISAGEKRDSLADEAFLSGELDEAVRVGGVRRIDAALHGGSAFDSERVAASLDVLLGAGRWREVIPFLRKLGPDIPSPLRLRLALAALVMRRDRYSERFCSAFTAERFGALTDATSSMDVVAYYVWLCILLGWLDRSRMEPQSLRDEALDALFAHRRDDRDRSVCGILFGAGALLGRALGAVAERGPTVAAAYLSAHALGDLLRTVLTAFSARRLHLPLGAHPGAKIVVQVASLLSRSMGRDHSHEVSNVFAGYVVEHALSPFEDVAWQHLSSEAPDALGAWVDAVLGDRGIAWTLSGTERLDVAQRFTLRARGTSLEEVTDAALRRIRWGVISYADHKDYSLDLPLQWFTQQAIVSPHCWETEGVRLLAVSREAELTGDNRLDRSVTAAVFDAACTEGASSVARLLFTCRGQGAHEWIQVTGTSLVPEACARITQNKKFRLDELRAVWCWALGCLAWQEDGDRGALIHIREQLTAAATRLHFTGFAAEMQLLGPMEWSLRVSPRRADGAERPKDPEPPSTIEEAERLFAQDAETSPRVLVPLALRLRGDPAHADEVGRLLRILERREQRYGWTFSGALPVYEQLVPHLSDDSRWSLVAQWVETRDYEAYDLWLDQARDIDALCRIRATAISSSELAAGTRRLLDMHELWRSGAGNLPPIVVPQVPPSSDLASWTTLAVDELLNALQLGGVLDVSTAMRGLYALCTSHRGCTSTAATRATVASTRTQQLLLLVIERLAGSHPEHAEEALPFIQSVATSSDISVRLQGWVTNQQLRRHGGGCEESLFAFTTSQGAPSPIVLPNRPLIEFPDSSEGRLSFGEPVQLVHHLLERVAMVTGEELDELESAFTSWLPRDLPDVPDRRRATRHFDIRLRESALMDAALRFLDERVKSGRWCGTPTVALAQAILLGDDPWVLLRTPTAAPSVDGWLVDDELDKALEKETHHVLLEKLAPLLVVGLASDEVLIGGMLSTYSRHWDVEVHCAHGPERKYPGENRQVGSTFGGRSFSWYDAARYERGRDGWLTLHHGGLMQFPDETFNVVPSGVWTGNLNWTPDPRNPTRWYSRDGSSIEFQRLIGPYRSVVREPLERQPLLQRWVCSRSTWEAAGRALRLPVSLHTHVRLERSPYANQ